LCLVGGIDKAGRVRRTIANYVANGNDPDAWQTDAVETWLFVQSTHRYREDNLIATTSYDAASRRQSSTSPMGNTQSLAYDVFIFYFDIVYFRACCLAFGIPCQARVAGFHEVFAS
jgi:YD repeat-containing protein